MVVDLPFFPARGSDKQLNIVVIGGGPAGCAAAIRLAAEPGISVTVVERGDYRGYRAGETLPPQAAGLLAGLGLWNDFVAAEPASVSQIYSAWASSELQVKPLMFQPHGRGWHIRRTWFDRLLAQAAIVAGASLYTQTKVQSIAPAVDGGWMLELSGQGEDRLQADFVIDASGRARKMARQVMIEPVASDQQLALVAYCDMARQVLADEDNGLLLETVPAGWMYCAPVTTRQCVVVLMTNHATLQTSAQAKAIWQQAVNESRYIQQRLNGYLTPSEVIIYPSRSQLTERCFGESWVAIGDAAMAYDPLTGMGITKAMADAEQVAEKIRQAFRDSQSIDFSDYAQKHQRAFAHYADNRRAFYQMEKRWPNAPYWREVQQL